MRFGQNWRFKSVALALGLLGIGLILYTVRAGFDGVVVQENAFVYLLAMLTGVATLSVSMITVSASTA